MTQCCFFCQVQWSSAEIRTGLVRKARVFGQDQNGAFAGSLRSGFQSNATDLLEIARRRSFLVQLRQVIPASGEPSDSSQTTEGTKQRPPNRQRSCRVSLIEFGEGWRFRGLKERVTLDVNARFVFLTSVYIYLLLSVRRIRFVSSTSTPARKLSLAKLRQPSLNSVLQYIEFEPNSCFRNSDISVSGMSKATLLPFREILIFLIN